MKLAKFKPTNENVIVLISSKPYKGIYEDRKKGNSIIEYQTLNYIVNEKYEHKFVTDEDLEILEEIEDD